jgi:ElaB/YqjD/DUF883 family membrane-anchored ribosome-binding protein
MKIFLSLVALFTLTGCMGLEQKFANARIEMMTLIEDQAEKQRQADTKLRETIAESTARVAAGLDTVEDHVAVIQEANDERDDEISESIEDLTVQVDHTWENLQDDVQDEVAMIKSNAAGIADGLIGGGPFIDLAAAAAAAVGLGGLGRRKMASPTVEKES